MKTANTILTTFLLSALAAAMPLRERDLVYVTATSEVVHTISTTLTITGPAATETAPMETIVVDQGGHTVSESESTKPSASSAPQKVAASSAPALTSSTVTVSSVSSEAAAAAPAPTTSSSSSASSSSAPSPSPTSSAASSSSSVAPSSTSSSAAPSSSSSSGSGSDNSGDLTYYTPGLGACGETNSDSDSIVALSSDLMGTVSNGNQYCGKKVTLSRGGKSVQATVVDKCPGCSKYSVDTTTSVFQQLATLDEGRVQITWHFD